MNRLLRSSKFQAAIAAIVGCVAVALGMSEDKADQIASSIMTVITVLTGIYMATAAAEDVAAKLKAGSSQPPQPAKPPNIVPMLMLLVMAAPLLTLSSGCSFLMPGADVRQAAEARSETSWDKDSNLSLSENTTHNRRVVMAEGEAITAEYYADGTPKKVDGATQLLSQVSEPKDAMGGYMYLAQKNAEVLGRLAEMVERMTPYVAGPRVTQPQGVITMPSSMKDGIQIWEQLTGEEQQFLLGLLKQLQPATTPTPQPSNAP